MIGEIKLLESIEISQESSGYYISSYSSENRISFSTTTGCYVLDLIPKKGCVWPNFAFEKFFIPTPTYNLTEHVGLPFDKILRTMPRNEFYETMLDVNLTANSEVLHPLDKKILSIKWSPAGLINKFNSALAVLTDYSGLHLYMKFRKEDTEHDYFCFANLTRDYIDSIKASWGEEMDVVTKKTFNIMKESIFSSSFTAIVWSQLFSNNNTNYCYLCASNRNGDLLLWQIDEKMSVDVMESNPKLITKTETNIKGIAVLEWLPRNNHGLLFFGTELGQIGMLPVLNLTDPVVKFGEVIRLWSEEDKIRVDTIVTFLYTKELYVAAVKDCHLFIYMIDSKGAVVDFVVYDVGNYMICGLAPMGDNKLILLTISGMMKELVLTSKDKKIIINWRFLYSHIFSASKKFHGFVISPNYAFIGFFSTYSRLPLNKKNENSQNLLICINKGIDPFSICLRNKSSMMYIWDCLETIRVACLTTKEMDYIIEDKDYSDYNFIQLKALMWIAKIQELYFEISPLVNDKKTKSHDYFLKLVELYIIIFRMQKILSYDNPSTFQLQNLNVLNIYLKDLLVEEYLNEIVTGNNIKQIIATVLVKSNEKVYPEMPTCHYCKESIYGLSCTPCHYDSRCAISLMQVNIYNHYCCPFCRCRVHKDMDLEYKELRCPYCDTVLDYVRLQQLLPPIDTDSP